MAELSFLKCRGIKIAELRQPLLIHIAPPIGPALMMR